MLNGVGSDRRAGRHRRPGRQRHPAEHQHRPRLVEHDDPGDHRGRRRSRCSGRSAASRSATCPGERVGNVGRNTLRADGIGNLDLGFIKNTRFGRQNLQLRIEMFNATNTRNFGIPKAASTRQLPQPVGHQRRRPHDLGRAAVHLLIRGSGVIDVVRGQILFLAPVSSLSGPTQRETEVQKTRSDPTPTRSRARPRCVRVHPFDRRGDLERDELSMLLLLLSLLSHPQVSNRSRTSWWC